MHSEIFARVSFLQNLAESHARTQRGQGVLTPPLNNYKNKGFLSNTDPDSLKNQEATKPAFHVEPPSARQQNAIYMAFRWWADDGPLLVFVVSSVPIEKNKYKTFSEVGPPLTKFSGSAHESEITLPITDVGKTCSSREF